MSAAVKRHGSRRQRIRERDTRPARQERGYDRRWELYSTAYRMRHPLCVHCRKRGRVTLASCVDHIEPVTGPDDPLFWVASNHQGLCHSCHNRKTWADRRRGATCRRV